MKIKMALVAISLAALVGCSANADRNAAANNETQTVAQEGEVTDVAAADESKLVCYHEKTIGSNRKTTRCMSRADRDKMREVSREAWLRQQQGSEKLGN